MNLSATMSLATGGFTNPLAGAQETFGRFVAALSSGPAPLTVLTAGMAAIGVAAGFA